MVIPRELRPQPLRLQVTALEHDVNPGSSLLVQADVRRRSSLSCHGRTRTVPGAESRPDQRALPLGAEVNDKATTRLMTEFIKRWRSGEPRAKAWREAQLSLLHSKGAKEDFSNPYFWAAFTLTGQWR